MEDLFEYLEHQCACHSSQMTLCVHEWAGEDRHIMYDVFIVRCWSLAGHHVDRAPR
jgi:hypothetical protein